MEQSDRVAECDQAFILPEEGKLVSEGNAVEERPRRGKVTVLRGQQRALVEGDKATGQRAKITLPALVKGKF